MISYNYIKNLKTVSWESLIINFFQDKLWGNSFVTPLKKELEKFDGLLFKEINEFINYYGKFLEEKGKYSKSNIKYKINFLKEYFLNYYCDFLDNKKNQS